MNHCVAYFIIFSASVQATGEEHEQSKNSKTFHKVVDLISGNITTGTYERSSALLNSDCTNPYFKQSK